MNNIRKISVIMLLVLMFSQTVYAETYEYDALDRVTKVIYDDGSYVTYEYDASGNMISTQVTEPEQEEGLGTLFDEFWESVGAQITEVVVKVVEQMVQKVVPVLNSLFGWLFR